MKLLENSRFEQINSALNMQLETSRIEGRYEDEQVIRRSMYIHTLYSLTVCKQTLVSPESFLTEVTPFNDFRWRSIIQS